MKTLITLLILLNSIKAFCGPEFNKNLTRFGINKDEETRKTFIIKKLFGEKNDRYSRAIDITSKKWLSSYRKKEMERMMIRADRIRKKRTRRLIPYREIAWDIPPTKRNSRFKRDPVDIYIPKKYKANRAIPLIISLHGYSGGQWVQDYFIPLKKFIAKKNFILAVPSGIKDKHGNQFWNATHICCDWYSTKVDDVGYLVSIIQLLKRKFKISKVIIMGHSNGGFMAHEMACDASDYIYGIVSWGGANYYKMGDCIPKKPVNILHLHGDKDKTIPFYGVPKSLPSAIEVVKDWSERMKCDKKANWTGPLIMSAKNLSNKSTNIDFAGFDHCKNNKKAILGIVKNGDHTNPIDTELIDFILDLTLFNQYDIEKIKPNPRKFRFSRGKKGFSPLQQ